LVPEEQIDPTPCCQNRLLRRARSRFVNKIKVLKERIDSISDLHEDPRLRELLVKLKLAD
jgi:hypothetical protein